MGYYVDHLTPRVQDYRRKIQQSTDPAKLQQLQDAIKEIRENLHKIEYKKRVYFLEKLSELQEEVRQLDPNPISIDLLFKNRLITDIGLENARKIFKLPELESFLTDINNAHTHLKEQIQLKYQAAFNNQKNIAYIQIARASAQLKAETDILTSLISYLKGQKTTLLSYLIGQTTIDIERLDIFSINARLIKLSDRLKQLDQKSHQARPHHERHPFILDDGEMKGTAKPVKRRPRSSPTQLALYPAAKQPKAAKTTEAEEYQPSFCQCHDDCKRTNWNVLRSRSPKP